MIAHSVAFRYERYRFAVGSPAGHCVEISAVGDVRQAAVGHIYQGYVGIRVMFAVDDLQGNPS